VFRAASNSSLYDRAHPQVLERQRQVVNRARVLHRATSSVRVGEPTQNDDRVSASIGERRNQYARRLLRLKNDERPDRTYPSTTPDRSGATRGWPRSTQVVSQAV
jgi:hypothetical protein